MFRKGNFPDILIIAKVVPFHKDECQIDLNNYRPILLLSSLNKVFEIILHKRVVDYWKKYNLFSNFQFGFRRKYSTNHSMTYFHKTVLQQLDCNCLICRTFSNFAKAIDCVTHRILLDKLEHYGVRGCALNLLQAYVNNKY